MSKKEVFLYIQAALWILWAVLMAAMAIRIYVEGAAYQAQGHPEVWIYTRDKAIGAFAACAPVLLAAVVMTIAGAVKGIRDDRQDSPVPDPDLVRIYKAEREASGAAKTESRTALRPVRAVVLLLAVLFIIAGIYNGSMEDTLIKAINICTECIGLG